MDAQTKQEFHPISPKEESRLSNSDMVTERDSGDSQDSCKISCPRSPAQPSPSKCNDSPRINTQQQNNHNSTLYRPSFMINDILNDQRHPIRNRSPVHPDSTTVSPRTVIRTEIETHPFPGEKRKAPEDDDSDIDLSDIDDSSDKGGCINCLECL